MVPGAALRCAGCPFGGTPACPRLWPCSLSAFGCPLLNISGVHGRLTNGESGPAAHGPRSCSEACRLCVRWDTWWSHQSTHGLLTDLSLPLDLVCGHHALTWETRSEEQRNQVLSTRSAAGGLPQHLHVQKASQAKKALGTAAPQTNYRYERCKISMIFHRTGMELYIKLKLKSLFYLKN